jgi:hypothetical protein
MFLPGLAQALGLPLARGLAQELVLALLQEPALVEPAQVGSQVSSSQAGLAGFSPCFRCSG